MTDPDRSRRRWRAAFLALLAVWILTLGTAAYMVVDQAVTLTYHDVSHRDMREDLQVLATAAPALGTQVTRGSLLATLRRQHPQAFIVATDSTVGIGQLEFRFGRDGRLRAVSHPELEGAR
jgi:hypothetical protein